ncbi:hypothetical protein ACHWQZ_G005788 [Mnemiopsis leidyi]
MAELVRLALLLMNVKMSACENQELVGDLSLWPLEFDPIHFVAVPTQPANEQKNKLGVEDDKTEVEDDKTEVEDENTEVEDDKTEVEYDKTEVEDEKTEVEDEKTEVEDEKTEVEDDKTEVEDDKTEVEDDKTEVEDDKTEVEDKKTEVKDDKTEVLADDHGDPPLVSLNRPPDTNQGGPPLFSSDNDSAAVEKDQGDFERTSLITLTTVNSLLAICCIILSILMSYFRIRSSSKRSLVQVLYLQNGLTDFFVGIGVLSQCPILYLMICRGREVKDITIPVYFSFMVTGVSVKMSVLMNCVLGTVRCINIVQPFYQINKKALAFTCLFYMVAWTTYAGIDLWQYTSKRATTNQVLVVKTFLLKGQPGFGLVLMTMSKEQHGSSYLAYHVGHVGNMIQFVLPTALPSLICLGLMIVQLYFLLRPSTIRKKKAAMKKSSGIKLVEESKASLTIFLLTCIYVGTSVVSILTWLTFHGRRGYLGSKSTYDSLMEKAATATSWDELTAIYFSLSICPLICSTLTPLTLLLRGSGPISTYARRVFTSTTRIFNSTTSFSNVSATTAVGANKN